MEPQTAEFEVPPLAPQGPRFEVAAVADLEFARIGNGNATPAYVLAIGAIRPGTAVLMPRERDPNKQRNRIIQAVKRTYGNGLYSVRKTVDGRLAVTLRSDVAPV